MKSRISSFKTALLKDLTRFAPAWALYLVGMLLLMLTYTSDASFPRAAQSLGDSLMFMGIINALYAGLCGQLLFGDLFNTRLCNALHAMPLRRETWFLSHVVAGLSFSLVPNSICALALLDRLGEYDYIALFWLAGVTLEYLFFFGLAVLSCLCSGNRFAMAAVYTIANFLSILAFWFINLVYAPFLYGIVIPEELFVWLCPVVRLTANMKFFVFSIPSTQAFLGFGENWPYLWILAGVGVVLLGAALLLYRRRRLESAGDFLAVRWLEPVFCVIYTLTVAAVFDTFGQIDGNSRLAFFIVGFLVGFLTGQMLLKRTVKIFTGKTILKLVLLAAVLAGSIGLIAWDPLGITDYVPETEEIRAVSISNGQADWGYADWLQLTNPEDVEAIRQLHQKEVTIRGNGNGETYLTIRYQLKNGRTVLRTYSVPTESVRLLFSRPQYVLEAKTIQQALEKWPNLEVDGKQLSKSDGQALLRAIFADCEAGTMAQNWNFHDSYSSIKVWVGLWADRAEYLDLKIFSDSENTLAWLKENYQLWADADLTQDDYFGK